MEAVINPHLGDPETFLREHKKLMWYIAQKFIPTLAGYGFDKNDVESAGMLALWKAYRTFNPSNGAKWATYAGTVINNELRMMIRKGQHSLHADSLDKDVSIDSDGNELTRLMMIRGSEFDESQTSIEEFVSTLSERDKQVLRMTIEGYLQHEIADELGISQSYISRLTRRIGNKYLKEDYTMTRPINGDVQLAEQLLKDGILPAQEIAEQTGVKLFRINIMKKEMKNNNEHRAIVESKRPELVHTVQTYDQPAKGTEITYEIERVQSALLDAVKALDNLKAKVSGIAQFEKEAAAKLKELLQLVG